MAHGPFIVAAFGIVGVAMTWLIASSYLSMKKSEALADDLRQNP